MPDSIMPPQFSVKIGAFELQRISAARKHLDDCHTLAVYAEHYLKLGWFPLIRHAQDRTEVALDFRQPARTWARTMMELGLQGAILELAVPLQAASLFVIRLPGPPRGDLAYYLTGPQAHCLARAGQAEQHFFVLPPGWVVEASGPPPLEETPWWVLGPGQAAPVPPTWDEWGGNAWQWLTAPWERPPGYPWPELLSYLEAQGVLRPEVEAEDEDLPWWQEGDPVVQEAPTRQTRQQSLLEEQVRQLTALTQAMEKQLSALQQTPAPVALPEAAPLPAWWSEWSALLPKLSPPPEVVAEFQAAIRDLYQKHPLLAAKREHVQMVVYCYRNYVKINPHFAGLSYREKLSQALSMARGFLNF